MCIRDRPHRQRTHSERSDGTQSAIRVAVHRPRTARAGPRLPRRGRGRHHRHPDGGPGASHPRVRAVEVTRDAGVAEVSWPTSLAARGGAGLPAAKCPLDAGGPASSPHRLELAGDAVAGDLIFAVAPGAGVGAGGPTCWMTLRTWASVNWTVIGRRALVSSAASVGLGCQPTCGSYSSTAPLGAVR